MQTAVPARARVHRAWVVAAVTFAWLLLDQLPGMLQLVGGAFIVAGVIVVKLGERPPRRHTGDAPPVRPAELPVAAGRAE